MLNEEILQILKSKDDDIEKAIRLLCYLTNKSRKYYEALPLWKLQHYFKQISFLFQPNPKLPVKKIIWLNGTKFNKFHDSGLATNNAARN